MRTLQSIVAIGDIELDGLGVWEGEFEGEVARGDGAEVGVVSRLREAGDRAMGAANAKPAVDGSLGIEPNEILRAVAFEEVANANASEAEMMMGITDEIHSATAI